MSCTPNTQQSQICGFGLPKTICKRAQSFLSGFLKEETEFELDKLEEKWGNLSVYFQYPEYIRRVICTTNIIESAHRQFRMLTKTKGSFPNDDSLLKQLYMGTQNTQKKSIMPIRNWSLTSSHQAIHFKGRLDDALNL